MSLFRLRHAMLLIAILPHYAAMLAAFRLPLSCQLIYSPVYAMLHAID